jgi:hypothetical protein
MNKNLKPLGSTLEEFLISPNQLPPAEQKLLDACRNGTIAVIGTTRPSVATPGNTVRAEFIRFLALQTDSSAPVHTRGIQLKGAYIDGILELSHCTLNFPLALQTCFFNKILYLLDTNLHGLSLGGSNVPQLQGQGLNCKNSIFLNNGFFSNGEIRLLGAKIGGELDCRGATLINTDGYALIADRAEISGGIFLCNLFSAKGEVRFLGAKIGGNLDCSSARLEKTNENALSADGAEIRGAVFLNDGFSAKGTVRLLKAKIGNDLNCGNATLENAGGIALGLDGAEIAGSVFMLDPFYANGVTRMLGIRIGGVLDCRGAVLENLDGNVLVFDRAEIIGGVLLCHDFIAKGEIRFLGAKIGGDLTCSGAMLENLNQPALYADSAEIAGGVFFDNQFSANGEIRLLGAKIGGQFNCSSAKFENARGDALNVQGTVIKSDFIWVDVIHVNGRIDLSDCHVNTLVDDSKSWSKELVLDGFTYQRFTGGAPVDAKARIEWLNKQKNDHLIESGFKPQPWEQLVSVLRKEGHVAAARAVAIEAQKIRRDAGQFGKWWNPSRWLHKIFGWLAEYGYRPLQTLLWMFIVWIYFAIFYSYAANDGVFAPSHPAVFQHYSTLQCRPDYTPTQVDIDKKTVTNNWVNCAELRGEYTTFNPYLYSLDVILPLVDLQQEKDWGQYIDPFNPPGNRMINYLTRYVMWFKILFGWVCSLLLVAVLSGLAKTDKD